MKEKITAKDCVTCGICCISLTEADAYADITAEDAKRLGKKFVRLHVLQPGAFDRMAQALDGRLLPYGAIKTAWHENKTGPLKGIRTCQCAALKGNVMHKVRCSVYKNRPQVCRKAVVPGDRSCREVRRMFREAVENLGDE